MKPCQVVEVVRLDKAQIKAVFTRKASRIMPQCAQEFNEGGLKEWISEAVLTLLEIDIFVPREQLGYRRPKSLKVVQSLSTIGGKIRVVFAAKASRLMGHASHVIYDGNIRTWVWAAIGAQLECDAEMIGPSGPAPGQDAENKHAGMATEGRYA
jgi:hypothetical protein